MNASALNFYQLISARLILSISHNFLLQHCYVKTYSFATYITDNRKENYVYKLHIFISKTQFRFLF